MRHASYDIYLFLEINSEYTRIDRYATRDYATISSSKGGGDCKYSNGDIWHNFDAHTHKIFITFPSRRHSSSFHRIICCWRRCCCLFVRCSDLCLSECTLFVSVRMLCCWCQRTDVCPNNNGSITTWNWIELCFWLGHWWKPISRSILLLLHISGVCSFDISVPFALCIFAWLRVWNFQRSFVPPTMAAGHLICESL